MDLGELEELGKALRPVGMEDVLVEVLEEVVGEFEGMVEGAMREEDVVGEMEGLSVKEGKLTV